MPTVSITSSTSLQVKRDLYVTGLAKRLNSLNRYHATAKGGTISITPLITQVEFFAVSPVATITSTDDFLSFLQKHPSDALVDLARRHAGTTGHLTDAGLSDLATRLQGQDLDFPAKIELLRSAVAQIDARLLSEPFEKVILPWFFSMHPTGRVLAVTMTDHADTYEFLLRHLCATVFADFDAFVADPARRKPFADLLPGFDSRVLNIVRTVSQYNGPFVDAFSFEGSYTVFILIPDVSIHRRSLHKASIFDCLAPFSGHTGTPDLYTEGREQDTVPKLHEKRTAAQTEEWLRYWLRRANEMFDSLYDLCTAIDNIGRVDMESYVRRILQVERVLFEVTWSTAMIDQFLRKVLSFAVIDKVTSFMDETTWGSDEAQRFTRVFSGQFLITRLPQIFRHPILQAEAASWLSGIYDDLLRKTHDHIFPGGIVSAYSG